MSSNSTTFGCPSCGKAAGSTVMDSRPCQTGAEMILRRRKCIACSHRFSTYEISYDPENLVSAAWRIRYERLRAALDILMEPRP